MRSLANPVGKQKITATRTCCCRYRARYVRYVRIFTLCWCYCCIFVWAAAACWTQRWMYVIVGVTCIVAASRSELLLHNDSSWCVFWWRVCASKFTCAQLQSVVPVGGSIFQPLHKLLTRNERVIVHPTRVSNSLITVTCTVGLFFDNNPVGRQEHMLRYMLWCYHDIMCCHPNDSCYPTRANLLSSTARNVLRLFMIRSPLLTNVELLSSTVREARIWEMWCVVCLLLHICFLNLSYLPIQAIYANSVWERRNWFLVMLCCATFYHVIWFLPSREVVWNFELPRGCFKQAGVAAFFMLLRLPHDPARLLDSVTLPAVLFYNVPHC